MISETLIRNQTNLIKFVMVDANLIEVPALGATLTVEVSKAGGPFVAGLGVQTETSDGWYEYLLTAAECDTIGPLAVKVTHAATIQQNLEYVVQQRNAGCREFTYTVTDSVTLAPEEGVEVWVTTDLTGNYVIWYGITDALGVARDGYNNLPCLDDNTYYFWKKKVGHIDDDNPDTEVVGP